MRGKLHQRSALLKEGKLKRSASKRNQSNGAPEKKESSQRAPQRRKVPKERLRKRKAPTERLGDERKAPKTERLIKRRKTPKERLKKERLQRSAWEVGRMKVLNLRKSEKENSKSASIAGKILELRWR
jgi:hypothetical protein